MYNHQLLDHFKNPRNYGVLDAPHFKTRQLNPSCGDAIALMGIVEGGQIVRVMFTGQGCMISQAAASMLTELVKGMPIQIAAELTAEDMKKLVGMNLGPNRVKCIMLCLDALQEGLSQVQGRSC